ncbi:MAG: hypothetical protein Q9172_005677 [Xanthocarpia lactea]
MAARFRSHEMSDLQFIVQPPQDEDRTTREGVFAGIEVVDLTEDDNAGVGAPRSSTEYQDTPRSPHIRIDPALGGGQEVRFVPSSRFRSVSDASLPPLPPHPPPPRTQPQLREEDECPICHQALPPKGPNGSETEREAHVAECIAQHFSSSVPRASRPHPSVATEAAVVASAAGATQSQNSSSSAQRPHDRRGSESTEQGSSNNNNAFERMGSQRRRVVGMIKYLATEKDCIGEAGEPAECVICFEEFEQGVEMGRLECLCKFHKACIRQWWDTKGPGSCPVHQGGLT